MFPDVLEFFPHTWQSQQNLCHNSCGKKHLWQCIVKCVEYISTKTQILVPNVKNQSDLVCSVKYVEIISRHQETLVNKALKLGSPCSIPSRNFQEPGFWIHIKGVISHPNVDWPCQDFTQGSAREQPSRHRWVYSLGVGEVWWMMRHPVARSSEILYRMFAVRLEFTHDL